MMMHFSMLLSDWFIYGLLLSALSGLWYTRQVPYLRQAWQRLRTNRIGMLAASVLGFFIAIALLDSIHFQCESRENNGISETLSLLDIGLYKLKNHQEKSYSAPFSDREYSRSIFKTGENKEIMDYAPLKFKYHILGTDKVGKDVFYESIKGIRTAVMIGTLTTVFMLPFALILGMSAGFFGGWVDDIIQYLYTTLSSIPGVLLISATILVMQVYIDIHPDWFPALADRADARLLALCFILGITSWSNLCRLLRAETMKLRELEFVQAAKILGVRRFIILLRHIMPNVMHIILITMILDFSTLVLAEAVLSYVGVGVDPTTPSWGNMINASRLELARDPIVWWPLFGALSFMFVLVLSANLFSDAVCDALNPKSRSA